MTSIEFVNPPQPTHDPNRARYWAEVAEQLMKNPGQWARVLQNTHNPNVATRIRQGKIKSFTPAAHFEVTTRSAGKDEKGRNIHDLYIRYIGGEQ